MTVSRRDALRCVGKAAAATAVLPFVAIKAAKSISHETPRYTHAEQVARIMQIADEIERDKKAARRTP